MPSIDRERGPGLVSEERDRCGWRRTGSFGEPWGLLYTSGQISAAMMMMMITKEAGAQQRDVGICTCWDSDDDDHR